jgi:hypothetical protein
MRALRDSSRRSRERLAGYVRRDLEGADPGAQRRIDLAHSAARAAARLAAAEARRRRGPAPRHP